MSNIGVGTIDQAMLAALQARFAALRLAALAGRTLIIDEVHAYDPYMTRILERLVEFHARAGGNVVLLSATLPLAVRQGFAHAWSRGSGAEPPKLNSAEFPLLSYCGGGEVMETAISSYRQWSVGVDRVTSIDHAIERIMAAAQAGQCVVWIRNTVREAMEGFDALVAKGVATDLFHARFAVADRLDIEMRVLANFGKESTAHERRGRVLVATQVVEQSLNLDFDLMVTDLAPIDLILQRAGRLHRHPRGPRGMPTLVIHSPEWNSDPAADWIDGWSKGTGIVYPDHGRLWLTLKLVGDGFRVPEDSRKLVEGVYGADVVSQIPANLRANAERARRKLGSMALSAQANLIQSNAPYAAEGQYAWHDENAPTRLGEQTREWVLCEKGVPIRGDVESSVISLRVSVISSAPECPGLRVGPWRKSLYLSNGVAACARADGRKVQVRYDASRGLTWAT